MASTPRSKTFIHVMVSFHNKGGGDDGGEKGGEGGKWKKIELVHLSTGVSSDTYTSEKALIFTSYQNISKQ